MSTQSAIQLATSIQSKVGSSLLAANNLLPRPEAAGVIAQAGGASLGVFLLRDLHEMQERTYQCVEKVAHILQSQLDLAEDRERRERDQFAELEKERRKNKALTGSAGVGADGDDAKFEELEEAINKGTIAELLTGGLTTALLAPQALKNLGKGLGKRLIKGGIFGVIAGFIADPIVNYINKEFDLELDQTAKDEIKLSMIGAGVGFGVAGIPGAIVGATVPMIAKVAQYIGGSLNANEIKDSDFAMAGIGTAAAGMFTAAKLGGVFAGSTIPAVATFGAALGSLPVLIGIGAAVAVGAGAMFIAKKIDEYQEMTLKKLEKTTAKLDKEMGEWAAREEEGLFERMGINLGQLSAMGEAQVAAKEANEQAGQDIEKFKADTSTVSKLKGLVDAVTNYSDDALTTMLKDGTKADNFFSMMENLKAVAAKGGFGADSGAIFKSLAMMSDRVQNHAKKLLDKGVTGGRIEAAAGNKAGSVRGRIEGGDQFENLPQLMKQKEVLEMQKADMERQLQAEQKKLDEMAEAGMKGDYNIFSKNEFEQQQALVKKLTKELENPLAFGTLANKLGMIESRIQKFGTTNGLLYNIDQLKKIMSDKELKELIQMSVQQQGGALLTAQKQASEFATTGVTVNAPNMSQFQDNKQQTFQAGRSPVTGDPYIAKEGFQYGL